MVFTCSCSAVIEYTNRVIFLEDNDVAAVTADGGMMTCNCYTFVSTMYMYIHVDFDWHV